MVASYCTLPELKLRLGGVAGSSQDDDLQLAIDTASRAVEDHCERHFWSGTLTRTYRPASLWCVKVDDLVSVTSLKADSSGDGVFEDTWQASDYQLLPVNASTWSEARPYTEIRAVGSRTFPLYYGVYRADRVEITGTFGWPTVPDAVKTATLILAVETYKLKDAPFGVQAYGDYGIRVRDNPRVMALLAPYRKHSMLVA